MTRSIRQPAAAGDLQVFKAGFFKAMAHPVRIRILEWLVRGELTVQELQGRLNLSQSVVSQQLAVLRSRSIVVGRKEGASVRYAIRDPMVADLLEAARRIFDNQLIGSQSLLRELRGERGRLASPRQ